MHSHFHSPPVSALPVAMAAQGKGHHHRHYHRRPLAGDGLFFFILARLSVFSLVTTSDHHHRRCSDWRQNDVSVSVHSLSFTEWTTLLLLLPLYFNFIAPAHCLSYLPFHPLSFTLAYPCVHRFTLAKIIGTAAAPTCQQLLSHCSH